MTNHNSVTPKRKLHQNEIRVVSPRFPQVSQQYTIDPKSVNGGTKTKNSSRKFHITTTPNKEKTSAICVVFSRNLASFLS
jgi:hypothetical protein